MTGREQNSFSQGKNKPPNQPNKKPKQNKQNPTKQKINHHHMQLLFFMLLRVIATLQTWNWDLQLLWLSGSRIQEDT